MTGSSTTSSVGSVARNAGIIPGTLWGAPKDLKGYTYDLDKAKQHLAMVKQPMRPLEIGVLAGFDQSEAAAQLLQAGLCEDRHRHQIEQRAVAGDLRQIRRQGAHRTIWCRYGAAPISPIRTTGPV